MLEPDVKGQLQLLQCEVAFRRALAGRPVDDLVAEGLGLDPRCQPLRAAAGADCFMFDYRVVRWNFQRGDGTNRRHYTFSSDPRTIHDIVAAFELAWNRSTPHAEYKPD